MKKLVMLAAAFLVTWDVSGFQFSSCGDAKRISPAVGLCIDPFSATRSASFDDKKTAQKFADMLKADKSTAYKLANVKMFQESK